MSRFARAAMMSIGLLVALTGSGSAGTILVPSDQPTIQAGLDAAAVGDTVQIACGTYLEHDLLLRPGVVLRSETGQPDCVTIDAQREGRVLFAALVDDVHVEGITLTGGFDDKGRDFGGGERGGADPGGVTRESALAPSEHDRGGGGGVYTVLSSVTLRDCVLTGNEATVHGGGVRSEGGAITLETCSLLGNVAGNQAGALYVGSGATALLTNCTATGNEARQGGTVYASRAELFCAGGTYSGNSAERNGGVVHASFADVHLTGCAFWNNTGLWRGGAVALFGSSAIVSGCTFSANDAPAGSAILSHTSSATVQNSILAFGTSGEPVSCEGAVPSLLCTDVYGNESGDFVGCLAGQGGTQGNFSADPTFCDATLGNLRLQSLSPCLPPNNGCGVLIGALGGGCAGATGTVVSTNPPGLEVVVDGVTYTSPIFFDWPEGSVHTIGTITPQEVSAGTRHAFEGWSDGGAIVHSITVPAGLVTYTATFSTEYLLAVNAMPGGSVSPGSGWHPPGAQVVLTATPEVDYEFGLWEGQGAGSYSGTDNPATVTMNGPVTETALFVFAGDYLLTMVADEGGTVSPPSGGYPAGGSVTIQAFPDPGYHFETWEGTGPGSYSGPDNPAGVVMDGPITEVARFAENTQPLTMVANPGGTVTPASGEYLHGSDVLITATPDSGNSFAGWTGSGPGSYTGPNASATITMLGPITETADFAAPVTMLSDGHGTVSPASGDYAVGSVLTIFSFGDPGYSFHHWEGVGDGSYTGTDVLVDITVNGPITQTAYFTTKPLRSLTMLASPGGSVQPGDGQYLHGTVVTIEAFPDSGFSFKRWNGTGKGSHSGPGNPVDIVMLDDITQAGIFVPNVAITVTTSPPGKTVTVDGAPYVSPATFVWAAESDHTALVDSLLPGLPGEREQFTGWDDGEETAARTIHTPDEPTTFEAAYQAEYFLHFQDPPEGISLPGDSWHPVGATVSIEAVANPTFAFESWTGQGVGSYTGPDNPATVVMDEPLVQSASFHPFGFDFSISASSSDPFENSSPPTGGVRSIHFWVTCAEEGLSAFEGAVSGDLAVLGFTPASGVLNIGDATNLLLAVGGCPNGASVDFRLGSWDVLDTGGTLCLAASGTGTLGAVDCDSDAPSLILSPRIVGFSSGAESPCLVDENPCFGSRPFRLPDGPGLPLVTSFEGAWPNPFRNTGELRFDLSRPSHVRLNIYNVSGRLVRKLGGDEWPPGAHRIPWNGLSGGGERVPAGVYFVQFSAGAEVQTRKIVLLR